MERQRSVQKGKEIRNRTLKLGQAGTVTFTSVCLMTKQAQPGLGWGEVPLILGTQAVGVQVAPLEADAARNTSYCGGLSGVPFTSRPGLPDARGAGATQESHLPLCLIHRCHREDGVDMAL